MTRMLVVRHGQTVWNAQRRIQGTADVDLDDTGRAQALAAAPVLASFQPRLIVSSDLRRAVDTAQAVADLTGLDVLTDKRLRERAYGPWEGLNMPEIAERFPDDHERWQTRQPLRNPDIETWTDLAKRSGEALRQAAEDVGDGVAIVVAHGGSARHGVASLLGWSSEFSNTVSGMDNCHWADLRLGRAGWRLHGYNVGVDFMSMAPPGSAESKSGTRSAP